MYTSKLYFFFVLNPVKMLRVYLNEIAHNTQKKNKSIKLWFTIIA